MAAIVNYRDLLLQGAASRYVPPATAFDPSTLGDLAYLNTVGTPQIQPGSITAGSGIVAPGAILTQALAPNAATISRFYASNGPTVIAAPPGASSPSLPEVNIATIPTFASKGGTVLLCFGMRTSDAGLVVANNVSGNRLVVRRNGFLIYTLNEIATGIISLPPITDTPGNGTPVSYTVGIIPYAFWANDGPASWVCNERAAYVLETIR